MSHQFTAQVGSRLANSARHRTALGVALALAVVMALAVLLAPSVTAADGPFTMTILHTDDTHANIMPCMSTCNNANLGGVARRYTAIQQVKAEGGNVLLVDAGDYFQGTLFFNYWQGQEASHFMNALGYQAAAIGNHEFDSGPPALARFIDDANFPVLGANIDASAQVSLTGKIEPYTIIQVGGQSIGVFGLTTEDTTFISSPGPDVAFSDVTATAQATVATLQGLGVNKIVALTHIGYDPDKALAAAVSGIDVIVGGHSHTPLGPMPGALGDYPTVVTSPAGEPVLIVHAWEWGKYLGRLDVTFDAAGVVQSYNGNPIRIDATIPEDPAIAAEVATFYEPVQALANTVVAQTTVYLDGVRANVRTRETNLGNLICDAMLWKTASAGGQICITNGGGIRSPIQAGDITIGSVLTVLPFGNTVATLGLTGADVLAALENGVSRWQNTDGRFPQVAGMRYVFEPYAPVGHRIRSAELQNPDGSFTAIDPAAIYTVVTNDFMRRGGDGYTVFRDNAINPYDTWAVMADSVVEYIQAPEAEGGLGGVVTEQQYPLAGEGRITATFNPLGNLVPNPGFELSGGAVGPMGWYGGGADAVVWDTANVHSGSRSAQVNVPLCNGGLDGTCVNRWWNPTGSWFTVSGMTALNYGGWYKANDLSGFAEFRLHFWDVNGTYLGQRVLSVKGAYLTDFPWTRTEATATVPANAFFARMDVSVMGTGQVWFDDVFAVAVN